MKAQPPAATANTAVTITMRMGAALHGPFLASASCALRRYAACTGSHPVKALVIAVLGVVACGMSLPGPPKGSPPLASFSDVPFPPPPGRLERVPDRPKERSVWVDGSWEWTGSRWRWKDGGWFAAPPPGVVYTQWETMRPDGTRLLFASADWRDRDGKEVPEPRLLASASMTAENERDASAPTESAEAGVTPRGVLADAGLAFVDANQSDGERDGVRLADGDAGAR